MQTAPLAPWTSTEADCLSKVTNGLKDRRASSPLSLSSLLKLESAPSLCNSLGRRTTHVGCARWRHGGVVTLGFMFISGGLLCDGRAHSIHRVFLGESSVVRSLFCVVSERSGAYNSSARLFKYSSDSRIPIVYLFVFKRGENGKGSEKVHSPSVSTMRKAPPDLPSATLTRR